MFGILLLQDQSQVPGLSRSNQEWIDSKDSAILIADEVEDEGSEVMLMMTWGDVVVILQTNNLLKLLQICKTV